MVGSNGVKATEKPNITVQVLPRDAGGSPGLEGPFTLLALPASIPDIGYTEGPAGTRYIEDRDRVQTIGFSGDTGTSNGGTCIEVAALPDGRIAVRNSNYPEAGAVYFTRAEMTAWIHGIKAGEFDDLGA